MSHSPSSPGHDETQEINERTCREGQGEGGISGAIKKQSARRKGKRTRKDLFVIMDLGKMKQRKI